MGVVIASERQDNCEDDNVDKDFKLSSLRTSSRHSPIFLKITIVVHSQRQK